MKGYELSATAGNVENSLSQGSQAKGSILLTYIDYPQESISQFKENCEMDSMIEVAVALGVSLRTVYHWNNVSNFQEYDQCYEWVYFREKEIQANLASFKAKGIQGLPNHRLSITKIMQVTGWSRKEISDWTFLSTSAIEKWYRLENSNAIPRFLEIKQQWLYHRFLYYWESLIAIKGRHSASPFSRSELEKLSRQSVP